MKKIKNIIFFLFLIPLMVVGQTYRIDSSQISFENKLRPCLNVIYDAPAKTVKQGWSDYFKKKYGIKTKGISILTNKDLINSEDVKIAEISEKRMNIYARVTDMAEGSELKFFMSFGYDFFIGPETYPNEFGSMHKMLNAFSIKFLNDYYASESSSLLKQIKGLERDIKKKNNAIKKNIRKSGKSSSAVSSALEAKNTALRNEIDFARDKIKTIDRKIELIKGKQSGILPGNN